MEGGGGDGPDSDSGTSNSGGYADTYGFGPGDANPSFGVPGALSGVADLSLHDQYQAYGAGRVAAETLAAPMRDTPAAMASAAPSAATTFNNVTTGLLSLLGLASGNPAGVIGGAKGLFGLFNSPSAPVSQAHDLGVTDRYQGYASSPGDYTATQATAVSKKSAPVSFGFPTRSTVLGYQGKPVNTAATTPSPGLKLFPSLASLFSPGTTGTPQTVAASSQYLPIGTTPTAQTSTTGILPAVMLALGFLALNG